MEKHKLDKLFADKLQGHEAVPSPAAWDKLEEGLNTSRKKRIWPLIGIAASAALVVLSSWYMLSETNTEAPGLYAYADEPVTKINVPEKIVYVPVLIQVINEPVPVPMNNRAIATNTSFNPQTEAPAPKHKPEPEYTMPVTYNTTPTVVHKEPLPVEEPTTDYVMASAKEEIESNTETRDKSLTIIYKQGTPKPKSKFAKAIDYMEEVRTGEKKLQVFKKLRESIESKIKSNKTQNSK